jgi:hypothetical protein
MARSAVATHVIKAAIFSPQYGDTCSYSVFVFCFPIAIACILVWYVWFVMCAGVTEVRCLILFLPAALSRDATWEENLRSYEVNTASLHLWFYVGISLDYASLVGVGANVLTSTIRCSNRSSGHCCSIHCTDSTVAELPVARGYFSACEVGTAWSLSLERRSICSST